MEQVVCKNIQWEKVNVWCCGTFFPFGNIKQHQNEAHLDGVKTVAKNRILRECKHDFAKNTTVISDAKTLVKQGVRKDNQKPSMGKKYSCDSVTNVKLEGMSKNVSQKQLKEQLNNYPKERKGKISKMNIFNICGTSILAKNMSQHIKLIHTMKDVNNFSCEYCGKSFKLNEYLTRHMAIHTGQKNFTCLFCNKKFFRKYRAKHCENEHNGIFRLSCDLCDYKTNSKYALNRHVNSHLGIKPYSCPVCKLKSGQKSDLRHHVRTQHKAERSIISRLEALYPQMYDASESNEGLQNDPLFQNLVLVKRSTRKSKWKDQDSVEYSTVAHNNDNATKKRKLFSPKSQKSELFPEVDESGSNENRTQWFRSQIGPNLKKR